MISTVWYIENRSGFVEMPGINQVGIRVVSYAFAEPGTAEPD